MAADGREIADLMAPELELLLPMVDEQTRRLVLGAVARACGDGGITAVAKVTGASWQTVANGAAELGSGRIAPAGRVRRPGGGRKPLASGDEGLIPALKALLEDSTRGDPQSPLVWTTRSVQNLRDALAGQGHRCGRMTLWRLLTGPLGFCMHANAKTIEGEQHPDRDAQFRYIAGQARDHMAAGDPVISVDTKKRVQVGELASPGREWAPAGCPVRVRDHSFPDQELGTAAPYGIYDVARNTGFVNVGTDHDTSAFAVASVRRWWQAEGRAAYPGARRLLITADAGGSNDHRRRAWKAGLAALAEETGLEITVCHFPPGTSKWNKIEHRLFSQITRSWRARPLTSHQVILSTIAAVRTATGLTVTATLDQGTYPLGVKISDKRMRELEERHIRRHKFHGAWNYALRPVPLASPGPPAPAADPAPAIAALCAAAGLTPQDLDTLAASLDVPWHARLEEHLWNNRGGPRGRPRATATFYRKTSLRTCILVTILHHRAGAACRALGALLSLDDHTIRSAINRTRDLLAQQHPHALTPSPAAATAFRDYAASARITTRRTAPRPPRSAS